MPARPRVSIIVPTYNTLRHLKPCVESVRRHTVVPYELILLDNASTDGCREYLRSLRGVRAYFHRKNRGFPATINRGMRLAKGEFAVWLNSDAVVTPGWLEGLLSAFESRTRVGGVGPSTNAAPPPQGTKARENFGKKLDAASHAWNLRHRGKVRSVRGLIAFCFLTSRRVFSAVGPMDERYFPGGYEDYDYCLRLLRKGYTLLLAEDVFVHHRGHGSFPSRRAWRRTLAGTKSLFIEKWGARVAIPYLKRFGIT